MPYTVPRHSGSLFVCGMHAPAYSASYDLSVDSNVCNAGFKAWVHTFVCAAIQTGLS